MKVFLDAGHGGKDAGAVNGSRLEKNDTLALTLKLGEGLKAKGVEVEYSRTSDSYPELSDRVEKANNWGADLYLSIHRNSASPTANGVETWVISNALNSTMDFATKVNSSISQHFKRNRGVKKGYATNPNADYYINKHTKMLSALLEIGFISNDDDNMVFDTKLNEIAESLVNAVCDYFKINTSTPLPTPPVEKPVNVDNIQGYVVSKQGSWNIREQANNNAKVVQVVYGGIELPYNGITPDGWYSVPNVGFIHRNCIADENTQQTSTSNVDNLGTVTVKTGTWNLRATPNGRVVEVLKGGTKLEYNGITPDNWYSIPNRGFIHKNALNV